jgi:hypothetical protein
MTLYSSIKVFCHILQSDSIPGNPKSSSDWKIVLLPIWLTGLHDKVRSAQPIWSACQSTREIQSSETWRGASNNTICPSNSDESTFLPFLESVALMTSSNKGEESYRAMTVKKVTHWWRYSTLNSLWWIHVCWLGRAQIRELCQLFYFMVAILFDGISLFNRKTPFSGHFHQNRSILHYFLEIWWLLKSAVFNLRFLSLNTISPFNLSKGRYLFWISIERQIRDFYKLARFSRYTQWYQ